MKVWQAHKTQLEKLSSEMDVPFYAYYLPELKDHLAIVRQMAQQNGVQLYYATKANPLSSIMREMVSAGWGIDVASLGELKQALSCGAKAENILATGPAKSKTYLKQFLSLGVSTFVVESANQLQWLNEAATELNKTAKVLLRVQLEWDDSTQSVLGGSSITAFGLTPKDWTKINLKNYAGLEVIGLHSFQWGNIKEEQKLFSIWRNVLRTLKSMALDMGIQLQCIDLGGGLGIPYSEDEGELDFSLISSHLKTLADEAGVKLIMELGRYAVGPFGSYVTQVIDRKSVNGHDQLVLAGGMNHSIRKALTGESYPCQALTNTAPSQNFKVYGPLCSALDHLGDFNLPRDLAPGDWLIFNQCGAYGFSESMPYFLCHDLAAEIVLYKNEYEVMRKAATAETYLR